MFQDTGDVYDCGGRVPKTGICRMNSYGGGRTAYFTAGIL